MGTKFVSQRHSGESSASNPFRQDFASSNGNGNDSGNVNRALVNALTNSKIYREYVRAFGDMTGMPLALQPVETWQLPHHGERNENSFCALISRASHACAACLQTQERLCAKAAREPQTVTCPAGLCDTAAPVRMSDRLVGYLQSGQYFSKKPDGRQFERTARLVAKWGVDVERKKLKEVYFATKVVSAKQQKSALKLLSIFAQHLAMLSNQVFIEQENAESPVIKSAREYIQEHQSERLSLGQVARAVNMSTFYFCKTFKKVTGINFTDYLSRVRIEKSKNLLLNPNLRVSEIAFEVGFQSLTHFNRVFKNVLGQSPTDYRAQLLTH
ncbi:MAG TPA: helix-turn-helix domain-containing protein [Candidatus Baltobacteraceae bacterium]|nr:helix-turn-helix domain-containing protein [Candidatus Baltobacteraceae bacterium]